MPYLYCHFRKDIGEPFYVGIGREKNRAYKLNHHSRTQYHKNIVKKHGIKISLISEFMDWETTCFWEKIWIKSLRESGYKIANLTNGGDGTLGVISPNRKSVVCLETGKIYNSAVEASFDNNLSTVSVSDVCNLKYRSANGLHFVYSVKEIDEKDRHNFIREIEKKCAKRRKNVEFNKSYIGITDGIDGSGRRASGPIKLSKKVVCLDDGKQYPSASEAARVYNVARSAVIELCLGKNNRKTVGGFKFSYVKDVE